ncbi:hypothetical protein GGE45_002703 [Rhizobium aethiopicum]|nr:hypothetical protein [Rhizobium aethiopicum]MBB4580373.1 hypothetical protein [Rhizobium aethiopicum]
MAESMDPKLAETEDEAALPPSDAQEDPGLPHDDGTLFDDGTGYAD